MKDGNLVNPFNADTAGVYLYDLKSGEQKLLVPSGQYAIGSPTSNQIAYEKNNLIIVLNLEDNGEKIIYHLDANEKIDKIHFSPDGRYIYLSYTYNTRIGNFKRSVEKMIDIGTGKEKRFKNIKDGFYIRTWK